MKRPSLTLLVLAVCCCCSVLAEYYALVPLFLIAGGIFVKIKTKSLAAALLCAALCLGATANCYLRFAKLSPLAQWVNVKNSFTAQLVGYPRRYENRVSGEFILLDCPFEGGGEKVLITVKDDEGLMCEMLPGGIYTINGEFTLPRGKRNPGGFDYSLYLKTRGIYACCVCDISDITLQSEGKLIFGMQAVYALRMKASDYFAEYLSRDNAYLAESLLFGENGLGESTLESYRRSGVAHILSVSGIHTMIINNIIQGLLRGFKLSKKTKFIACASALGFYCVMTGFLPPVVRACIMMIFANMGDITGRKTDMLNSMCLCALAMLLVNPLLIVSSSFVMSFACVGAMAVASPVLIERVNTLLPSLRRGRFLGSLADSFCVALCVNAVMLPICAYYFNSFSYVAIFSNLIIGLLVDWAMRLLLICLAVGFLPGISAVLFSAVGFIFSLMNRISALFASLPFAGGYLRTPRLFVFIIYYALLLAILGYINISSAKGKSILAVCMAAALISYTAFTLSVRGDRVSFLDVGQADCSVIHTGGGKTILIDSGRNSDSAEDILKFLWYSGINRIDCALVTHSDSDHAGGLVTLMEHIEIGKIVMNSDESPLYAKISAMAHEKGIDIFEAHRGDIIGSKDLSLRVLSPDKADYASLSDNDRSIILLCEINDIGILYLADAGEGMIRELTSAWEGEEAQIIKAAHHGGYNGATMPLYSACMARCAVISVGAGNSYSLPNFELLLACEEMGIELYRTDRQGCITVRINKGDYDIEGMVRDGL